MRIAVLAPLLLISLCGCATSFSYGEPLLAAHEVSFPELLGDASWFDNQPVRAIGVAGFDFRFETSSKLFSSEADREHGTYSYIELRVPPDLEALAEELLGVNGQYVEIDGVFTYYARNPLPIPSENRGDSQVITVCQGICGAVGYIEVNSVRRWR